MFGNPHWFWSGSDRFYQVQLTIPGKLNVSGVSFLGYPVIMIGFNEHVAWSHTFSTAQRFGLFELALDSAQPTTYQVDGTSEAMRPISITIETRDAEGNSVPVTRTLYRTRHGPVIDLGSLNKAFGWNASTALAIRDVNENNFRALRTFFYWNQSQSLNEFSDIQRREVGMHWVNTAAVAGNDGRAWYNDIGARPNVPDELRQRCIPTLGDAFAKVYSFILLLDGSRSACEWITDPRATQTGAVPAVIQPELFREDYVANMNDSYWSSNLQHPLEGYPSIMGAERSPLTLRTRLGHHIAQSAMNKGERTPNKLSKRVRIAVLDARVYSAELFKKPVLAHICRKHYVMLEHDSLTDTTFLPSRRINISDACRILGKWPNSGNAADRGGLIWDAFWARIERIPKVELYHIPFSPSAPLETPNALNVHDPRVTQAFGAGVLAISASKLAMDASRGSYLYARNGGYRIPLYGGCPIAGYFAIACDENGYEMTRTSYGNSYMQVVSFGKEGVEAYTLLSHGLRDALFESGQTRDTDSNLRRYANKKWLLFPFREADIILDPKLKRTVLYPDLDGRQSSRR
nr:penicillin acylase family protein [Nitrosospira sp. Nl5]